MVLLVVPLALLMLQRLSMKVLPVLTRPFNPLVLAPGLARELEKSIRKHVKYEAYEKDAAKDEGETTDLSSSDGEAAPIPVSNHPNLVLHAEEAVAPLVASTSHATSALPREGGAAPAVPQASVEVPESKGFFAPGVDSWEVPFDCSSDPSETSEGSVTLEGIRVVTDADPFLALVALSHQTVMGERMTQKVKTVWCQ